MNALDSFRQQNHLTYAAIAVAVGMRKPTVWRHCHGEPISGESALLYHTKLGIPLADLRPDLWPAASQSQPEGSTREQPQNAV